MRKPSITTIKANLGAAALTVATPVVGVGSIAKKSAVKVADNYRENKSYVQDVQANRAANKAQAKQEAEFMAAQAPQVIVPTVVK